jgi:hypothetical protein
VDDLASAIEGLRDYDAIDRFVTFAEQLDVAADLVQADTLPTARMALAHASWGSIAPAITGPTRRWRASASSSPGLASRCCR